MKRLSFVFVLLLVLTGLNAWAQTFTLANEKIVYKVVIVSGSVVGDTLSITQAWANRFSTQPESFQSDGNFGLDIFWTDWAAPGKIMNADNELHLGEKDFRFLSARSENKGNLQQLTLLFQGPASLRLKVVYQLPDDAYFIRRKLVVYDTLSSKHFLQALEPLDIAFKANSDYSIVKQGGFGQPIALALSSGGVFFGLEYPAATQYFKTFKGRYIVKTQQNIGRVIDNEGISSDWAVIGITPDKYVKWWFYRYLDYVRVAPLKPYTLYNTWYDLRSPFYPGVTADHVMNEENVMHIIDLFKKNMIDKYGIQLDAFVLDDGWDIYESAWELNKQTFPHGLRPVSEKLQQLGISLGIWLSPCGGYSFRNKRINYMRSQGYEVTGQPVNYWDQQLCLAGKNYSALFKKRITDFVKQDRIAYFKWDGIQFSCSNPTHGHPVGIYSRRAIMDTVISMCNAVRSINPDAFLNITSGTWLSPWWVKYANTIWMQGGDYGYADVPSISTRDAAMTYRDYVLYEDFAKYNFWFPISNLMTHGIIKGKLQRLGDTTEPFDKFTNNAVLYFARGISMYELYISPDILNDRQWQALAQAIKWAKANFDILKNSFFIGGNPAIRQAYGYVHFSGDKGIIALRNPFVDSTHIKVVLSPALGLNKQAHNLVLEQVYPYHQVLPRLLSAGDTISIPLIGYETAVFEVYPVEQASYPLIIGAKFTISRQSDRRLVYTLYDIRNPRILNPASISKITNPAGKKINVSDLQQAAHEPLVKHFTVDGDEMRFSLTHPNARNFQIAVLFENKDTAGFPEFSMVVNNQTITPTVNSNKDQWIWLTYNVSGNNINGKLRVKGKHKGRIKLYAIYDEQIPGTEVYIKTHRPVQMKIYPPEIYKPGTIHRIKEIGSF